MCKARDKHQFSYLPVSLSHFLNFWKNYFNQEWMTFVQSAARRASSSVGSEPIGQPSTQSECEEKNGARETFRVVEGNLEQLWHTMKNE